MAKSVLRAPRAETGGAATGGDRYGCEEVDMAGPKPERAGTEARDLTTRPRRHDWDNGTGVIAPETT